MYDIQNHGDQYLSIFYFIINWQKEREQFLNTNATFSSLKRINWLLSSQLLLHFMYPVNKILSNKCFTLAKFPIYTITNSNHLFFFTIVTVMCFLYFRIWRETKKRQKDLPNLQAGGGGGGAKSQSIKKDASKRSNSR
jgi:preprotein translocase subunit YajC